MLPLTPLRVNRSPLKAEFGAESSHFGQVTPIHSAPGSSALEVDLSQLEPIYNDSSILNGKLYCKVNDMHHAQKLGPAVK